MFLFRFIKFLKFRRSEKTPEWQAAYDCLCEKTDYLFLRQKELKGSRSTTVSLIVLCAVFFWMAFHPLFTSYSMIALAFFFSLVSVCYLLTIYAYIPIEIEVTKIYSRTAAARKPSSVAGKRLKKDGFELTHKYYIYTTESRKRAVDMADRILGVDQEYKEEETVFCFTGLNKDAYYLLPRITE